MKKATRKINTTEGKADDELRENFVFMLHHRREHEETIITSFSIHTTLNSVEKEEIKEKSFKSL